MESIFQALCGVLYLIGVAFGFNYEEISVYVCIYLWPALCCIMIAAVLIAAIYNWIKKMSFLTILNLMASSSVAIWFFKLTNQFYDHYEFLEVEPYEMVHYQFVTCQNDLIAIADRVGMTYAEVNIYIYCYLFAAIALFTWLWFEITYPKKWIINRLWRRD